LRTKRVPSPRRSPSRVSWSPNWRTRSSSPRRRLVSTRTSNGSPARASRDHPPKPGPSVTNVCVGSRSEPELPREVRTSNETDPAARGCTTTATRALLWPPATPATRRRITASGVNALAHAALTASATSRLRAAVTPNESPPRV
jgi:hypothetical protein